MAEEVDFRFHFLNSSIFKHVNPQTIAEDILVPDVSIYLLSKKQLIVGFHKILNISLCFLVPTEITS